MKMLLNNLVKLLESVDSLPKMSRRQFGILTATGALAGCSSLPKKSLEEVSKIQWECNSKLPILERKIYTGTNVTYYSGVQEAFANRYGLTPALAAPGMDHFWAMNEGWQIWKGCRELTSNGVVPVVRYITVPKDPSNWYDPVVKGKHDDHFKRFGHDAAKFEDRIVVLPWQCANEPHWWKHIWSWSRGDSDKYVESWVRMHDICRREGANNIIWSTKMIARGFGPRLPALSWSAYTPPEEYVDIIGWNCNGDIGRWGTYHDIHESFSNKFTQGYNKAVEKYPTKPQVFWELGAYSSIGQANWIDKALALIENHFHHVKGIMFDLNYDPRGDYNPTHRDDTVAVVKKHYGNGRYLGTVPKSD